MADLSSRGVDSAFQGLVTTTAIFAAVGGAAAIAYEVLRQFRRLPDRRLSKFWRHDPQSRHAPGGVQDTAAHTRTKDTCEDWEMGHLYHARVFHATNPSPPLPRWPFAWIKRAIQFNDLFYAEHTGMDTVVYVRFLRACFYWVLLQTLTTAPILLTIHIKFSRGVSSTDMARASLSYLVAQPVDPNCVNSETKCATRPNPQGRSLLWIHLTLLWYLSITWILALWWVGSGSLRIRKAMIAKNRDTVRQARLDKAAAANPLDSSTDNSDGWRQRTLMVLNLPATMRDEASIRRYFEEFLRPDDESVLTRNSSLAQPQSSSQTDANAVSDPSQPAARISSDSDGHNKNLLDPQSDRHLKSPIQTVVLVRKMNELASMLARRQDVLNQLEAAHVKLAQDVLVTVAKRTAKLRKRDSQHPSKTGSAVELESAKSHMPLRLSALLHRKNTRDPTAQSGGSTPMENPLPPDLEKLGSVALTDAAKAKQDDLARRLARFSPANRGLHPQEAQLMGSVHSKDDNEMGDTIWEALHQLPRELLDPFQPATRLSALFRGQTVPTIDYLLTKLNLLTALVNEMRSRPPTSYEPTTTAFVTFRDPRQARMVWRELKDQIVVKVRLAPEVKDLDWDRLMKTSFTGDVVRSVGVAIGTWAFTIFWVIIINFITIGVFSVKNLKQIPGLNGFFERNPNIEGFVSITLPPIIVSLISMSIPELIFQVSKRAQGFVTFSALYDMCLVRYWKFVICNVVIFFCVGSTAIETILTKVGDTGSILDTIGTAFPTAAPFFVSYLILQLALQSGFEHVGFMIALLQHYGANKSVTPRTRAIKTLPRNFNRYYWLPLHLNIMAIVFIFALLNPLMIPFALVYLSVALVVFKKNFAYHYYRRFNEMEGVVYFTRMLRFTLDSIIVMQAVLLIFFSVIQEGAVYIGMTAVLIPLTVITKVIATRLWKSQCRAVDDDEADALCGIDSREVLLQKVDQEAPRPQEAQDVAGPLDARASGRYPTVVPPPTTGSNFHRAWQKVHDSFNANGLDKPSYLATAHANGKLTNNPVESGARGFAKTPRYVIGQTAKHAFHYRNAAKALGSGNISARASVDQVSASPREQVSGLPATSRLHEHRFSSSQHGSQTDLQESSTPLQTANFSKKRKGDYGRSPMSQLTLRRGGSRRSEERPFLSGFEAVSAHAPVPSEDDYDLSFEDGDAPFLARSEEEPYNMSRRSRLSGNPATVKRKRSQLATVIDEDTYDTTVDDVEMRREAVRSYDPLSHSGDGYSSPLAVQTSFTSKNARKSEELDEEEEEEELTGRDLVRMHPAVRWDDTPNNSARYNNPFYNQDLDTFLWLPRNPIAPLDLCDTIEWYGPALVSSQGGRGIIGEWDDDQDSMDGSGHDDEKGMQTDDEIPFGGEAADMGRSHDVLLGGHEEIVLPDHLARHLEQVETVDDAVDPGASVPRNMMEQYKRAIRRNSGAGSDASSGERNSSSLFRRPSNVSASSGQGYAGPGLLQIPSGNSGTSGQSLEAPSSPKLVRKTSSHMERKTAADPLSSVPEAGVMIPRRSTSRRGRTEGNKVESHDFETDAEQKTPRHQASTTFASGNETQPSQISASNLRVPDQSTSRVMRRDPSGPMSRASGYSTDTAQRTVTLRAALRAEALEEERRIGLRERLAVSKRRKRHQHATNAPDDLPDNMTDAGADALETASTIHPNDSIMGRYEAQHRQREATEFGARHGDTSHTRDISTGSMFVPRNAATNDNSSRFRSAALGVLNISRASRVTKRNNNDAQAPMAMQDLSSSPSAVRQQPARQAAEAEPTSHSLAIQSNVVPSSSMPSIAESSTPTPSVTGERTAQQMESTPAKPRSHAQ